MTQTSSHKPSRNDRIRETGGDVPDQRELDKQALIDTHFKMVEARKKVVKAIAAVTRAGVELEVQAENFGQCFQIMAHKYSSETAQEWLAEAERRN